MVPVVPLPTRTVAFSVHLRTHFSCLKSLVFFIAQHHHSSLFCRKSRLKSSATISMSMADNLGEKFRNLLASKRLGTVPLTVVPTKPVQNPMYQTDTVPTFCEAMSACPKNAIHNVQEAFVEENFYVTTEEGDQGQLPVLMLQDKNGMEKQKPVIVCLHSSYKCKEWLRPLLEAYASRGYLAVAVDSRYHGERAKHKTAYRDVWDLMKLADYLSTRNDVASSYIGITGESLGGMHAWFAAVADPRYSVIVPIIGVQNFRWAIENDKWHARVASIQTAFEEAKKDLEKPSIDAELVQMVWDKIAPGLAGCFDASFSVPFIAPRPLLIINGEKDPRCPVEGLYEVISKAENAYTLADVPEKFKFIAESGVGHCITPFMVKEASNWFDKFLMNEWIRSQSEG